VEESERRERRKKLKKGRELRRELVNLLAIGGRSSDSPCMIDGVYKTSMI
jgi:hypothetical protein